MPWFSSCCSNCSRNWYSRTLHTAEKHHPTMFHTATVRPTRSGPNILYNTSLSQTSKRLCLIWPDISLPVMTNQFISHCCWIIKNVEHFGVKSRLVFRVNNTTGLDPTTVCLQCGSSTKLFGWLFGKQHNHIWVYTMRKRFIKGP